MGRVNYGPQVGEYKGLVGGVCHERQYLHTWDVAALELPDLPEVDWSAAVEPAPQSLAAGAQLLRGSLGVSEPADAYLLPEGFGKGYLWVNGFCLGRYWARGPPRRAACRAACCAACRVASCAVCRVAGRGTGHRCPCSFCTPAAHRPASTPPAAPPPMRSRIRNGTATKLNPPETPAPVTRSGSTR